MPMRMQVMTSVGEPDNTYLIHTPAKLNLFLNILGKRADGFHDLETLMVSIRLFDTIRFESSQTSEIKLGCRSRLVPHPDGAPVRIPTDDSNLIVKAAKLLQEATGCSLGAKIFLEKRIPAEAGLGGGSSDAAATLIGLNKLWKLELPHQELHTIAAQLGSDVNFFLDSADAAVCTGRGEVCAPFQTQSPLYFVLIKPYSGLSTGAVFREWASNQVSATQKISDVQDAVASGRSQAVEEILFNSLQCPATVLNDDVNAILKTLQKTDVVGAAMTGSGSTCFALCHSQQHARRISNQLKALRIGETFVVRSGV